MIRTLVVDDHAAIREGLVVILASEPGIAPIGAVADTASALEFVARARPRCVIVDRQLGSENGLELIAQLRALPDPPGVVLYSAFVDEWVGNAAAAAGAGATVAKDAPVEDVLAAVKRVGREGQRPSASPL